jgi:hypothetical protein
MDKLDDPVYQTRYNKRIDKVVGWAAVTLAVFLISVVIWRWL